MNSKRPLILSCLLLLVSLNVASNEVNPFTPIFSAAPEGAPEVYVDDGTSEEKHPLQRLAAKSYVLMGVITSKDKSLALVRAGNGGLYFLQPGDLLGKDGGVITDISSLGIEVTEEENVVSISVRNRSAGDAKIQ